MSAEEKSLRKELHELAVREGLTAEMLTDLVHEWAVHQKEKQYKSRKAHLNSIYGMRIYEACGSPEEMYCEYRNELVKIVDRGCYHWRQGCRACAIYGYSDSYTHG